MPVRKKILIVDDAPDNIAILNEILAPFYNVIAATNGIAALELAHRDHPPDLVLLDMMMPGMDGLTVCRRLKAETATATIPVIFVTVRDEVVDESAGFACGAADYIVKPVAPEIVLARVRVHLTLQSALQQLENQNELLLENLRFREQVEAINRHDLKSPLTVVINVPIWLMKEPNLSAEQKASLAQVVESGRRMLTMVNRTIDLYRMERGTYEMIPELVDCLSIIGQIRFGLTMAANLPKPDWDIRVNGKPREQDDRFELKGEPLLLYSAFENLLKNAIEASASDSTITIALDSGEPATISFHNSGAIPKEIRGRFFEKFATFGKSGGTGLGAYSARLMVSTMGGKIECESDDVTGTTITLRFEQLR